MASKKLGGLWRSQISRRLHELQIVYDSDCGSSEAIRSFVGKNYAELKTLNPRFPFLVRPIKEKEPQFVAIYGRGYWEQRLLAGKSEAEIEQDLFDLVKIGEEHPRGWPVDEDLPPAILKAGSTTVHF
mmetsp:Transcript_29952/g.96637  ORF Transcript_29952/g.96637 Transcript_29952/m.96637 type:complete len:128 (-) Transcript_29952:230-613(-)